MEGLISEINIESASNGVGGIGSFPSFQRRIEFHPARKPYTGFSTSNDDSNFKLETLHPSTSNPVNSKSGQVTSGKKTDGSDFWENGLDPELSFGITFRRIGAGLENLGNTCFLNSVLQCLTYTEPLAAYLQSGKHQNSCRIAGFCALCAIQKHVSRALQAPGRILAPKDLVLNLRCISRNFRISRQEDAHEYMVNLLESMHKCCIPSGVPSESPGAYEKSLVHKIFGGRLRSQVKCTQCSYCSNKFDPFLDLSLEIIKADSVHKALTNFTAAELLDGGEKQYQCQRCKQKVRALKQFTVHKAPYVLTVHLKRFRSHDPGQKIDKKVQFGPTLDMKPFVSDPNESDLKYTLYGVLVHHGWSTHSGHYYCFVRTSSGMWYSLDDNRVVQVSEKSVLEQKAYMLFYVRDRRKIVPKRPIDAIQKENMRENVNGNKRCSALNYQYKENLKSNPVEKKIHGSESSSAARQNDTNGVLGSNQTRKDQKLAEFPVSNKDNILPPSVKSNGDTSKSENTTNTPKVSISNSNETGNAKKELEVSSTVLSNSSKSENSANDKLAMNENLLKIYTVSNGGTASAARSRDSIDETLKNISDDVPSAASGDHMEKMDTANEASCEKIQVEKYSADSGNSPNEATESGSLLVEALDHASKWKLKKKKKLLKSQIKNMHFGLKIFKASLGLRKNKKHKKSKHRALGIQNLSRELLKKECISNSGPSTSEDMNTIPSSSQIQKRAKTCNGNIVVNTVNGDFKERACQNGAVLATDEHLQNGSEDGKTDMLQDTMSKLTQGLIESTIPRWDGIEVEHHTIESKTTESFSIGYVPDEWDEEYDRGKRKKLRQKPCLGGPNPFQEIAVKKSQVKKAKLDRTCSGNQPFRIR